MIRCLLVFILWLLVLGFPDVNIKWSDGWKISLHGWGKYVFKK